MCLRLPYNTASKPPAATAAEDIYTFKVLKVFRQDGDVNIMSPYRGHPYALGEMQTSEFELQDFPSWNDDGHRITVWNVEAGLHTFSKLSDRVKEYELGPDDEHAFVFVAIIPKGAKYYHGCFYEDGDSYASDKLVVLSREDPRSLAIISNEYRELKTLNCWLESV